MPDQNLNVESTYTPINGLEAKKLLKSNHNDRIDKIPLLKIGNAFHMFKAEYALIVTAYPADCPVPEAEFAYAINAPELAKNEDLREHFNKIELLEQKRERLLKSIEAIDKILNVVRPVIEIQETLDAGKAPDNLRIDNGLPVPVLTTSPLSGRKSEVSVNMGARK